MTIHSKLRINSHTKSVRVRPTTKDELIYIIKQELKRQGPDADLNFIDTSEITDMSDLFRGLNIKNIKVNEWDVSNVTNMRFTFVDCNLFVGDVSNWDVSNVKDMYSMFINCYDFNGDLSKWGTRVSNVTNCRYMFYGCYSLRTDLSNWKLPKNCSNNDMFTNCDNIIVPDWYRSMY